MSTPRGFGPSIAAALVRLASRLVPKGQRDEWREEWLAELAVLAEARRADPGTPGPLRYAVGAVPHALWTMTEGWTMESVLQDARFAARTLVRAPVFSAVVAVTLALGIGVNATIFSLVDGLLLTAPPSVESPDRLVQVARSYDGAPRWDNWSWPAFEAIAEAPVFEGVAGYSTRRFVVGQGADAELVPGSYVTGGYFGLLGVRAAAGRLIGPADDVTPGGHPVAVLGYDLWQGRYGGDPAVVGSTIPVGGVAHEVLGVAPRGFGGVEAIGWPPSLFVPTAMVTAQQGMLPFDEWGWSWMDVVARLAPGTTYGRAEAAMETTTRRLREASPINADVRVLLAEGVGMSPAERAEARTLGLLLAGIAGLVLVLTCANVANLFLSRASGRTGEMGVRSALGAGRARLARQLTTESVLLGVAGAVAAVPLVMVGARLLEAVFPYPLTVSLAPDARVLAVLLGLGVVAGLLFGAVPSVVAARRDLAATLRASGSTGATGRTRGRDALVVGQMAVSLALLTAALLLGRSVMNAASADPGFDPRGVLVASVDAVSTGRYEPAEVPGLLERVADDVRALPGVQAVAVASQAPFGGAYSRRGVQPADRADDPSTLIEAEAIAVGEGYFDALRIPVLEGRALRAPELEPEPVVVVNLALARRFWPGESAVGKEVTGAFPQRVVGVVGDVQYRTLRAPAAPAVYTTAADLGPFAVLHVRSVGDPLSHAGGVRRIVAAIDPGVPVASVADLEERVAGSLGTTGSVGVIAGVFAGLALVLALVGLYGLIAYGVSRRIREMGIRMALGARPGEVVALVLRRGVVLAAAGVALGWGLAVVLGRALEHLLFGVGARDPVVLALSAAVLVGASLLAAWVPARRASRVHAAASLRE